MTRCRFNSPGEGVYSSRIPNEFTFPDWLEVDKEWFAREVGRLMLEYRPGEYHVNVVHSTYNRPFKDRGGFWRVAVHHQAFAVDFHSVYCLSPGHGVIVGTVVVPAVHERLVP